MATVAVSSSAITTVAVFAPAVVSTVRSASSVPIIVRVTVSLSSSNASSITSMLMVADVWPARMVTLPGRVVKSLPLPEVPVTE